MVELDAAEVAKNESIALFYKETCYEIAFKAIEQLKQDGISPSPFNVASYMENIAKEQHKREDVALLEGVLGFVFQDASSSLEQQKLSASLYGSARSLLPSFSSYYKQIMRMRIRLGGFGGKEKHTGLLSEMEALCATTKKIEEHTRSFYEETVSVLERMREASSCVASMGGLFSSKYFFNTLLASLPIPQEGAEWTNQICALRVSPIIANTLTERTVLCLNRKIASLLQQKTRKNDFVGYLGKGVFLLLLPHVKKHQTPLLRIIEEVELIAFVVGEERIHLDFEHCTMEHETMLPHVANGEDAFYRTLKEALLGTGKTLKLAKAC